MPIHRRRRPHIYVPSHPVFLTWRLDGSLPSNRSFPNASLTSGKAFDVADRLLDEARTGPSHLRQPEIAHIVIEALSYSETALNQSVIHSFVIMPNHVHLLATPNVPLSQLTQTIKTFTARKANQFLGLTGRPFWQDESYDHLVRSSSSFERIRQYIEHNPVRAGLAIEADQYHWSTAHPSLHRKST